MTQNKTISGRCYCGGTIMHSTQLPKVVSYCHCNDCRRVTGAPVAAFAAFEEGALSWAPNEGKAVTINPGVTRTFCETCGSPLTGRYDYLPGTVYVALGILDQANELSPQLHSHHNNRLDWLCIEDDLERAGESARAKLQEAAEE
jgi:hypothetical protein